MIGAYCPICKIVLTTHEVLCCTCVQILKLANDDNKLLRRAANYLETKG
jgi:hypothetical protein